MAVWLRVADELSGHSVLLFESVVSLLDIKPRTECDAGRIEVRTVCDEPRTWKRFFNADNLVISCRVVFVILEVFVNVKNCIVSYWIIYTTAARLFIC